MKTLYLLRHAKSSWKDDALEDPQRPLKRKGHFQADLLSDHLSSLLPPPQRVLCSPAVRTRETLKYFLEVWPLKKSEVKFEASLYLAERDDLFAAVQALPDKHEIVLLVGHNPGLTDFARNLLNPENGELDSLRTCSFLQIDFEVKSWREVTAQSGRLKLHLHPTDVEG